jgi:large subunit ribosomal protein L7/L12
MTTKKLFTPAEVIEARARIVDLNTDVLIARGYVNIAAVLGDGSAYEVWISVAPERKIQAIKAVRQVTAKGLAEAKEVVDQAPSLVLSTTSEDDARDALRTLRENGVPSSLRRVNA